MNRKNLINTIILIFLIFLIICITSVSSPASADITIPETSGLPGPAGWAVDLVLQEIRSEMTTISESGVTLELTISTTIANLGGGKEDPDDKSGTGDYPMEVSVTIQPSLELQRHRLVMIFTFEATAAIEGEIDGFDKVEFIPLGFTVYSSFDTTDPDPVFQLQKFELYIKAKLTREEEIATLIKERLNQNPPNFINKLSEKLGNVEVFIIAGGAYGYNYEEELHEFVITLGQGAIAKVNVIKFSGEVNEEVTFKATGNSLDITLKSSASAGPLGKTWSKNSMYCVAIRAVKRRTALESILIGIKMACRMSLKIKFLLNP